MLERLNNLAVTALTQTPLRRGLFIPIQISAQEQNPIFTTSGPPKVRDTQLRWVLMEFFQNVLVDKF